MKRPVTVTIISWFLIIYSIATLLPKIYILVSPEAYEGLKRLMSVHSENELISVPLDFQIIFSFVASLVSLSAGVLMLKGFELGRSLIIIWILCSLTLVFLVSGHSYSFFAKVPISIIIIILLFRAMVSEYFKGIGTNNA